MMQEKTEQNWTQADSAAPKGKLTEILQKRAMAAQPALSGTEDRL